MQLVRLSCLQDCLSRIRQVQLCVAQVMTHFALVRVPESKRTVMSRQCFKTGLMGFAASSTGVVDACNSCMRVLDFVFCVSKFDSLLAIMWAIRLLTYFVVLHSVFT